MAVKTKNADQCSEKKGVMKCRYCGRDFPESEMKQICGVTKNWCKSCDKEKERQKENAFKLLHQQPGWHPPSKKMCSRCKQIKDSSCFGKDNSKLDGLTTMCKQCKTACVQAHGKISKKKETEFLSDEKKLALSEKIDIAIASLKEVVDYILQI